MVIVRLVEEHVLTISTIRREVFENSIRADPMFQTQLLPELRSDYEAHMVSAHALARARTRHSAQASSDNAL